MISESPHYLLFSEASQDRCSVQSWRFVLQHLTSQRRFSAADSEPAESGQERLELLAVVRGLEALDRPSRVTLVTRSRYVNRGIKHGLSEWRANGWCWERFGRIVPVRDHDLWQRVDQALRFHQVDCQAWQFDATSEPASPSRDCRNQANKAVRCRTSSALRARRHARRTMRRGNPRKLVSGERWTQRWSELIAAWARPRQETMGAAS